MEKAFKYHKSSKLLQSVSFHQQGHSRQNVPKSLNILVCDKQSGKKQLFEAAFMACKGLPHMKPPKASD